MIFCDVQSHEEDDLSEPPTPPNENEQMVIEEGHYPIPQLTDDIQDPTPMSVNESVVPPVSVNESVVPPVSVNESVVPPVSVNESVVPPVSVPHPQQPTEHSTNDTEDDGLVHTFI